MKKLLIILLVVLFFALVCPVMADTEQANTYDLEEQINEQHF